MTSDTINKFPPLKRVSVLKGERLSFQVLLTNIDECLTWRGVAGKVSLSGDLSKYASVRKASRRLFPRRGIQRFRKSASSA